jgi:hypothetical protein
MPAGLADTAAAAPRSSTTGRRRLFVVWQNPDTRQFVHVGHLDRLPDGEYEFAYEPNVDAVEGFSGFAAFPDIDRPYRAGQLFPFFTNRVLSPRRPEYPQYVAALGLGDAPEPVEILARSGGGRATDTVHVVPEPQVAPDGRHTLLFLTSGVRYIDGVDERLSRLAVGDHLTLRPQPDNPVDRRALLVDASSEEPVGWVPRYLLDLVHDYLDGSAVEVYVERINGPEVVPHLRLLCRLEATPATD